MNRKWIYLLLSFSICTVLLVAVTDIRGSWKHKDQQNSQESKSTMKMVDFKEFFGDSEGCAVFYSVKDNRYDLYKPEMAEVRATPCSTFKIISSLAGLNYGVIKDKDTVFKWDGTEQPVKDWNQDLSFESAFKKSAVWYFARVVDQVGKERMNAILKEINYGNLDTSGDGAFWLGSTLEISPMEQVRIVKQLFNDELPFTKEQMELVRSVMFISDKKGVLSGKTGSSGIVPDYPTPTAWFIGDYKTYKDDYYFAVRIYGGDNISGQRAKEIATKICEEIYY